MNLGATQQLAAENQELKARIAVLEQAVAVLQKQKQEARLLFRLLD